MSSDTVLDPVGHFDPAEALALAERANAAAHRPQLLPAWYGPAIGALLAAYGTSIGIARSSHADWLVLVNAVLFAVLMGVLVRIGARSTGVVGRLADLDRGWRTFVRGGTAAVLVVAGAAGLACAPAGGLLGACGGAGVGAGLAFWALMLLANQRIRRAPAAA
ncbi:hypothetical protein [Kitasatospora sp. NBC_01266]|uniref:hypothetical protein n=1 Tax=Kitasatospora sp. NBC_01266 TaxID=2903572 RepID=UPI002E35BC1A|nr:hypothetical protein [Kitasatospora sp. NBC_01266]